MTQGHSVTTHPAKTHVEVKIAGTTVAVSDNAVLLEETGLPTRYYLPRSDVRTELFRASDLTTHCPFKGDASYLSLDLDGKSYDGIAWSYLDPTPAAADVAGYLSFYPERVETIVDGRVIDA